MAITCKTFGQSVSQRLGILDDAVAYDLDCAAALVLRIADPDPVTALMKALAETVQNIDAGALAS